MILTGGISCTPCQTAKLICVCFEEVPQHSGLKTKSYFSSGEFTGVECMGTLDFGCQHCKLSLRVNKEHGIAECESSF